jgi:hypothetical protein
MKNIDETNASDSEDSAPESISFDTGKLKTTEETLKVKEQVNIKNIILKRFLSI